MGQKARRQPRPLKLTRAKLERVYGRLFDRYGPQHWWPGETPFEIMVGAVLTQNTAWSNVERAISNLRQAGLLELQPMAEAAPERLAGMIRPAGYFNVKAQRLQHLCRFLMACEGLEGMDDDALRDAFLGVHGVGPETADDILLYAFGRPVFVIDAYTRRLFSRLGLVEKTAAYEALRLGFESALGPDVACFNEYHALIVHHAKHVCRSRPLCDDCCLMSECDRQL